MNEIGVTVLDFYIQMLLFGDKMAAILKPAAILKIPFKA